MAEQFNPVELLQKFDALASLIAAGYRQVKDENSSLKNEKAAWLAERTAFLAQISSLSQQVADLSASIKDKDSLVTEAQANAAIFQQKAQEAQAKYETYVAQDQTEDATLSDAMDKLSNLFVVAVNTDPTKLPESTGSTDTTVPTAPVVEPVPETVPPVATDSVDTASDAPVESTEPVSEPSVPITEPEGSPVVQVPVATAEETSGLDPVVDPVFEQGGDFEHF